MARNEGFKYWSDQEFVQGFDTNAYLMSQSVMRFDNSADRDSALARTLTSGMLAYDKSTTTLQLYDGSVWVDVAVGTVGVTDHGALTGLGDDDHLQYLTEARGDARYYTETEIDALLTGKSDTSHVHSYLPLTGGTLTGDTIYSQTGRYIKLGAWTNDGNWAAVDGANGYLLLDGNYADDDIYLRSYNNSGRVNIGAGHSNTLGVDNGSITVSGIGYATNWSVGTGSSDNAFVGGSNYWRPQDLNGNSYFDINSGQFYVDSDVYYFRNRSSVTNLLIDSSGNAVLTGSLTVNNNIYLRSANGVHDSIYRVGGIYFTWDSDSYGTNTQHSIRSTDGDTWSDDITINSYGNVRVNIDTNNNGGNAFYIQSHGTGTGNIILYVPDTGAGIYLEQGWFRAPDDNGFYFENHGTGMRSPISEGGTYGSVATYGGENGWEGWSIGGRVVFMHNMSNNWGIYNDVNNEWMIYGALNGGVYLYYNNSVRLDINSTDNYFTGTRTVHGKSTAGSAYTDSQFQSYSSYGSGGVASWTGHIGGQLAPVFRVWTGTGEGFDCNNYLGNAYRYVGGSSFVTRSSERIKRNIKDQTDDEIIPTIMDLLSCRTIKFDDISIEPYWCEHDSCFKELELCEDYDTCGCDRCAEIMNAPLQKRHFGRRGYLVEELAEVYPTAVHFEEDGKPSGIDYSAVTVELIDAVKLLVLQGDEINRRLTALET